MLVDLASVTTGLLRVLRGTSSADPTLGGLEPCRLLDAVLEVLQLMSVSFALPQEASHSIIPVLHIFERYLHSEGSPHANFALQGYATAHKGGELGADTKTQSSTTKLLTQA